VAKAATALGWRAWVKPVASCAVFAAGPLAGQFQGQVVKVELPGHVTAYRARLDLYHAVLRELDRA
jgi:hypothetical protein